MNSLDKLIDSGLCTRDSPIKLHLGCGATKLDGYIDIDYPQEEHNVFKTVADAEADIVKDLVFPESSVDEIRSHHVFEHFSRVIALAQLVKWYHWVKIDGTLIIETPDAIGSVVQLADEATDYQQKMAIVRHLVGDQAASWGYHKDMWFGERFETTFSKLGFHVTDLEYSEWDRWPHLRNIKVSAIKLQEIPVQEQFDSCCVLLKDSMVSEREIKTFEEWKKQLVGHLEGYLK